MFFDGACSREGASVGVVLVSPCQETISLSYKLEFEATNNVAEYEALILGLRDAREMGIQEVAVFRDVELVVQQIISAYQAKHPRLRSYRNEVWDLIDSFFSAFNISFIPREENTMANSLATSASNFKVPLTPKFRYDVEVKYRPSIPNNENILRYSRMISRSRGSWRLSRNFQKCTLTKMPSQSKSLMGVIF